MATSTKRGLGGRTAAKTKKHVDPAMRKATGTARARKASNSKQSPPKPPQPPQDRVQQEIIPAQVPDASNHVQNLIKTRPDSALTLRINAVIRDFGHESPAPGTWQEWIEVKAGQYSLTVEQVVHALERLMHGFPAEVKSNMHTEALTIAKAIGGLRLKAIRVLEDGLDAMREVFPPGAGKDGELVVPVLLPDLKTRLAAYDRVARLYGMEAPSKMEVEHDVSDRLLEMGSADILARFMQMARSSLGKQLGPASAEPPTITITADDDGAQG